MALENNVGVAKYLLEHSNININLPDNEGRTPLHVAAWQGHLEMVELLVQAGEIYFCVAFFFSEIILQLLLFAIEDINKWKQN